MRASMLGPSHRWMGWCTAGLAVRLIVAPFLVHVDPRFVGDLVGLNQFAYLWMHDPSRLEVGPLYPPLAYYTISLFQWLLSPVSPPVTLELYTAGALDQWAAGPLVFRQLFLFKIWYLLFDLGAAFLLWRLYRRDPGQQRRALLFWLFNPLLIYTAYFHGQFDLLPIFFTVLALYLARDGRATGAVFCIGLAACTKNYAFFFLPPAILILSQSWRKRLWLLLVGTVPYALFLLPHLTDYTQSVSGYGDWFFKVGYDVGFGGQVYLFFALYAALLWILHRRRAHTFDDLWRACFAILLVYYQLGYFDLHYWAWITPFAVLYWVERPREATPFYAVILACLVLLLAPTPLGRFLAPISPRFFLRLPSLMEALSPTLPMLFLTNVVRSLLAGTCFYLAWRLLRDMPASRPGAIQAAE